jgi:hypothetical protein
VGSGERQGHMVVAKGGRGGEGWNEGSCWLEGACRGECVEEDEVGS